jgi:Ca2+-binding EF-hand superfamily protein
VQLVCAQASASDKILFSFKMWDINKDGSIDEGEMYQLLSAAVQTSERDMEAGTMPHLQLSSDDIKEVCRATMAQVDTNGSGANARREASERGGVVRGSH